MSKANSYFVDTKTNIIISILMFVFRYFQAIILLPIFLTTFTTAILLVVQTPFEEPLFRLISITPGINYSLTGEASLNNQSVVTFFGFWGLVVTIVSIFISKFFKINLELKYKKATIILLIIHILFLVAMGTKSNFLDSAVVVLVFLIINFISLSFYYLIDFFTQKMSLMIK